MRGFCVLVMAMMCLYGSDTNESQLEHNQSKKSPLAQQIETLGEKVNYTPKKQSDDEKLRQKILGLPDKPIDGVNVKVVDVNVSKNSKISVEVSPKIEYGDLIDNEEKAIINYKLKF
jgi:hypothetical protein